ncbi:MAG: beta-ketoacyl-[acyl-carrier-protein] synthase II [Deltaproteobacteria bacterium]|nr:MAG: beta-ketoacyl-[acyl-carrier-protein] synthase II [Deltaproteobacteria bacterium]
MRRVVITGIGLVTPLGNDRESTWSGLVEGKSGIGPITHFDASEFSTKIAGEVKGWVAEEPYIDKREARHFDDFLQFGITAGLKALEDAGYEDRRAPEAEAHRWGSFVGAGLGGVQTIERTYRNLRERGPRHGVSPYFVCDIIINMIPGMLTIKTGATGPNFSHVSACSSGAHSIGEAMRAIQYGSADLMIAGGAEATVSELGIGGFASMRALSTRNDEPERASRPFDKDRDGFVCAEGAGVVVLEELEHAKRRGARIYCELVGYGANSDAYHMTQPAPEGRGARACIQLALEDAKVDSAQVGYINAHGTSTPFNDKNETAAIRAVFGAHADRLAVSSTKSMTGHMLGAAGGVEAAITALAIHRGVLPPTINYETPDPECDLDYVPNAAREVRVDVALSNSFGFGGTNACLVFKRYAGD